MAQREFPMSKMLMKVRRHISRVCVALIVIGQTLVVTGVSAQQALPPQGRYYVGEGEVDVSRGVFLHSRKDISVGPADTDAELILTRSYGTRETSTGAFGGSSGHNHEILLFRQASGPVGQRDYTYRIVIGTRLETFEHPYSDQIYYQGITPGFQLFTELGANGPYTYTGPGGVVINFGTTTSSCPSIGLAGAVCALAQSVVEPSGRVTEYEYENTGTVSRVRLVKNNYGYALGFEYTGSTGYQVSKICSVNLAVTYVTASAPCLTGSRSAQYSWPTGFGPITGVTDASGKSTAYGYASIGAISSIQGQASSVPDIAISYDATSQKVSSVSYAGQTPWTYIYQNNLTWLDSPSNGWTKVKSPLLNETEYTFSSLNNPTAIENPLGKTTNYTYTAPQQVVLRKTEPEGNYVEYGYDGWAHVTQTTMVAKPGSGLSNIVSSAAFANCPTLATCDKPSSTTDARGNTTSYTYNSTHGGVLTETGPAVGGVTPQRRYSYAQRYAWIKNSGGSYVQASAPVWVRTEERFCKTTNPTTTGCTGGASDEVVTTYDYGPNSGPNNLNLRGIVVDSGGLNLRTCYGYDESGNRISETQPKAGLTSCP